MDAREQRGREIAERYNIVKRDNAYIVPSQSGDGSYRVTLEADDLHCSCPDFELRGTACKHVYAAAFFVQRQTVTETVTPEGDTVTTTVTETAAVRLTYSQNWPAYNKAQSQEKELFCRLLGDLCATVPEPVQEKGRPRIPAADALFSACFKVYSTMSSRRFMTDLREAHSQGLVSRPWHFNTVLKVIEDPTITETLYGLVTASAAPLRSVESSFAVDSTGFGTQCFYRHFAAKYGKEKYAHDWIKLHALVGTTTNVIAVASVTDRNAHDAPQFAPLLRAGAESFDMAVVTADKAYASRQNVSLVADLGGTPYIPMKANAQSYSLNAAGKRDSMAWRWLYHLYNLHRDEFLARYHVRSNAESTFSAMKRVFGDTLRSKTRPAQVNELLLKVIAHNIVCLIHSMFELGVPMPKFG